MMKMLNNQARNSLVNVYETFKEAKEVSAAFEVTKWTVYKNGNIPLH